jgi:cation transport regulator ChaB
MASTVIDNGDMEMTRGSRPVPDPTQLTDAAIARADKALRDWTEGKFDVLIQRLDGIDEATKLLRTSQDRVGDRIGESVGHLKELHGEKFDSVAQQFKERDTRSERESRDNKVAVDAAFAAQKEAAAAQDKANREAIDKSERATAETIKTNQELNRAETQGIRSTLEDLKLQVNTISSLKLGAKEDRTSLYAGLGIVVTLILATLTIVTFVIVNSKA